MAPKSEMEEDLPHEIDPYAVLGIETAATAEQVKSAYRKLALKYHPDKATPEDQARAHTKFQEVAFAYAILSDARRRSRYDTTGNTAESLDDDDFNWTDFFRAQKRDVVTAEAIKKIKSEYQASEEEKDDILAAYRRSKGSMDAIYEQVMCSNVLEDDQRFRKIIDQAIADGTVQDWTKYTSESEKKKNARRDKALKEAKEADGYASEIKTSKAAGKTSKKAPSSLGDLAALIQKKDKFGGGFLDRLEAKYGTKTAGDEPPEEAFVRNQKKGKGKRSVDEEDTTKKSKKRVRS